MLTQPEKAAEESWVLLKNDNDFLPVKNTASKVAVVGNLANKLVLGDYSGTPTDTVTPIEGITQEFKNVNKDTEVEHLGAVSRK